MGLAQITVNMTNSTGDGPITLQSVTFPDSGIIIYGNPPLVTTVILAGATVNNALLATGGNLGSTYYQTKGTCIFNLPNGDTLTITWDIVPFGLSSQSDISITTSSNTYEADGKDSPSVNGFESVYNLNIKSTQ